MYVTCLFFSVAKLDALIDQGLQTIAAFRRNKSLKRLNHNEEQIHKFDKYVLQLNRVKCLNSVSTEELCLNLTSLKYVVFRQNT